MEISNVGRVNEAIKRIEKAVGMSPRTMIRFSIAIVLILLSTEIAFGGAMDTFPPKEYDYLFPGPIVITRKANLDELNKVCGGNRLIGACGTRIAYACQMFVLKDKELESFGMSLKATIRHEIGHCNGWPGNHPGMRRLRDFCGEDVHSSLVDCPSHWYDLPPEQIFEGPSLVDQLIELGKRHLKEME